MSALCVYSTEKGGKPRDSIKTKHVSDNPGLTEKKLVDPLFLFCRHLQYTVGRNEKKTIARYCPFKEPMSIPLSCQLVV